MRLSTHVLRCALVCALPLSCGSEDPPAPAPIDASVPTDMGTPPPRDVQTVRDVPVIDRGPLPDAGSLYQPCATDDDCPGGTNARCNTQVQGWPRGFCTRVCPFAERCGTNGLCTPATSAADRRCLQTCRRNADCREGYGCLSATVGTETVQVCQPLCSSDTQCPGSRCNPYRGSCGAIPTTGTDTGGTCSASSNMCRSGLCRVEEVTSGTRRIPTGFLGGYCISRCILPSADAFMGERLPRGGCPMQSVCIAENATAQTQGIGTCMRECMADGDCRAGYTCLHPDRTDGSGPYTNGYCAPLNCRAMDMNCPAGFLCVETTTDGGPVTGRCLRMADGGA